MKYYCEFCGNTYNSEEKCLECENKHKEDIEKQKIFKQEKQRRWNEVQKAYEYAIKIHKKTQTL